MQPSDSRPPVGRGSGRPWPVAYPVPRATRRKKGLPGAWAVLFQRAVGSDPAGCASRRAHRVETAIAFRLHNALGTQNERYFVAVNPTAHSLACLRIGVFVTADAARLATGVGGSPFTGRVSHPLDGKQSFMTSPHRHSPLTSLAWSHHATTPLSGGVNWFRNEIDALETMLFFPTRQPFAIVASQVDTWDVKVNNQIQLPRAIELQASYIYYAGRNVPQGRERARSSVDLAGKWPIMNERAELLFTVTDIFNDFAIEQEIEG